ncbi:hypothetical protein ES708_26848 [subsurface metagenome]
MPQGAPPISPLAEIDNPFPRVFFVVILTIPPFPCASYLADGTVIISILSIFVALICDSTIEGSMWVGFPFR